MIANFLKTLREELLGMSLHEYKKPHKTKMIDQQGSSPRNIIFSKFGAEVYISLLISN